MSTTSSLEETKLSLLDKSSQRMTLQEVSPVKGGGAQINMATCRCRGFKVADSEHRQSHAVWDHLWPLCTLCSRTDRPGYETGTITSNGSVLLPDPLLPLLPSSLSGSQYWLGSILSRWLGTTRLKNGIKHASK